MQRISAPIPTQLGMSDFGRKYVSAVIDAETIVTYGAELSPLVEVNTRELPPGQYRISWSVECDVSTPYTTFYIELQVDGATADNLVERPLVSGIFQKLSSTTIRSFTSIASHSVKLLTRLGTGSESAAIKARRARLEMFRVG